MPNYNLQINSQFQPFSFDELVKPYVMYGQAYKDTENAYTDLDTKASIWENLANQQTDPIAYAQYKKYSDDLKEQADILATEGLNPSVRAALNKLRGRYSSEIVPIEQAYQRRAEQIAEQRKLGNSSINSYDAALTSLDTYLSNPSLSYERIDREDLYKRAVNDFGQIADQLADYGVGKPVDKYTNTLIQRYGITRQDAARFVNAVRSGNIDTSDPTLAAIYKNLYNSTNVDSWNNPEASNIVSNTILEGVAAGIGKWSVSPIANRDAIYQKELDMYRARMAAKYGQSAVQTPIYRYGPTNQFMTKKQRQIADKVEEFKTLLAYFDSNPEAFTKGQQGSYDVKDFKENDKRDLSALAKANEIKNIRKGREEAIDNYEKLMKLSEELTKEYTNDDLSFDFATSLEGTDAKGNPVQSFSFSSNLADVINGLAERRRPVMYRTGQKGMSKLTNAALTNIDIAGHGVNGLIANEDNEPLSKKEFEKLHDLHWDDAIIYYQDGNEMIMFPKDKGVKYILKPGALGDISTMFRPQMDTYYGNKQYEDYTESLVNYMNALWGEYNTEVQGQTETSSKSDFNLLNYTGFEDEE